MEKIIVVGAGLSGATIARLLAESGKDVIVVDKRENIGGNVYDYVDKNGITIQQYGAHAFHTNDKGVYEFLSKFTEWRNYEHKVLARVRKDKLIPVPFNLTSLFEMYPLAKGENVKQILINEYGLDAKVSVLQMRKHLNPTIREFADFVYKNVYSVYTLKLWGYKPEQLGDAVMGRVPVRISNDDRYCTDQYQCMPQNGFTEMVANILRHPKIRLKLRTDIRKEITLSNGQVYFGGKPLDGILIYTGCVDELFNYKYGVLPYRSLKFKLKTEKCSSYQQSAVINYTTSASHTRITEFTKFTCKPQENTVISKEYPVRFKKGRNVPYYPIPIDKNLKHYEKYKTMAEQYKNLYLLGRLATYKNINMDEAVRNAINLYEQIEGEEFDLSTIANYKKDTL